MLHKYAIWLTMERAFVFTLNICLQRDEMPGYLHSNQEHWFGLLPSKAIFPSIQICIYLNFKSCALLPERGACLTKYTNT